jgi:acyl-homoserine-lactone acylase
LLNLIFIKAETRGRTAEYFGPGTQNANVENDVRIQTYGIPERAQRWYREGGFLQQSILQAFVSGLNQYANKFADSIIRPCVKSYQSSLKMCSL